MTQRILSKSCESVDITDPNAGLATPALESRRRLLCGLAASAVSVMARRQISLAATSRQIQAIAFDAFAIFDIRAVAVRAKSLFPEKAEILTNVWTAKLFSYSWLLTSASRYLDFESIAMASLKFAADSIALVIDDRSRDELVATYSQLSLWPDVEPALRRLRAMGIRLAFLSNMSETMLLANMQHAGIGHHFEAVLSTDTVRQFKPAPAAYQMAADTLNLPKSDIGYAAFAGWDALGAAWFGYPTAWINRLGVPAETLQAPFISGTGVECVLALTEWHGDRDRYGLHRRFG